MNELSATLTTQEWDYIGSALGRCPYAEVSNLVTKLASQLQSKTPKQAELLPEQD